MIGSGLVSNCAASVYTYRASTVRPKIMPGTSEVPYSSRNALESCRRWVPVRLSIPGGPLVCCSLFVVCSGSVRCLVDRRSGDALRDLALFVFPADHEFARPRLSRKRPQASSCMHDASPQEPQAEYQQARASTSRPRPYIKHRSPRRCETRLSQVDSGRCPPSVCVKSKARIRGWPNPGTKPRLQM
jgi:hypothetical protein